MFATRRTELGKEHIRPIQVGGESFDMNTPGGANRRCDCDGYRPDTLGGGIGLLPFRRYGKPQARSDFVAFSLFVDGLLPANLEGFNGVTQNLPRVCDLASRRSPKSVAVYEPIDQTFSIQLIATACVPFNACGSRLIFTKVTEQNFCRGSINSM